VPAEIVVDTNKVKGCLQSIVIPDFNVRKYVTPKDNVIRFIPDKKGKFSYSCSMGMGYGQIIVN
jgi:plastocyanin domain-containing protein